jgi:hypothetical protein
VKRLEELLPISLEVSGQRGKYKGLKSHLEVKEENFLH